ncbi:MAG: hypothetical protein AAGL17_14105 [Cyanobacteria bacterium J06576_12]
MKKFGRKVAIQMVIIGATGVVYLGLRPSLSLLPLPALFFLVGTAGTVLFIYLATSNSEL